MALHGTAWRNPFIRRVPIVAGVAALGLALSPVAAHATETLSATGSAWAIQTYVAYEDAVAGANGALSNLAQSRGETCTDVTDTVIGYYAVPGAPYGFWYEVQATGTCS